MPSGTEPSSSFDSRIGTSSDNCESCAADGGDLQPARPITRPEPPLFASAETVVASKYALCCAMASAIVAVLLLGMTGAVWYRYVIRPNMLPSATSAAARSHEEQPRVLVVVVEATQGSSAAATKPAFMRGGNISTASVETVTARLSDGTDVAVQPKEAPTEDPMPAPL